MRNFDNYDQIFDNEKNFLVGCLIFCKKGTTDHEKVYSWDSESEQYVEVNSVQFISVDGRPNTQLYLVDKDYTIYVQKYIGNDEMETDTDPSHWAAQYSFNNLYDVFGIEIEAEGIQVVGTLADLHALDPATIAVNNGVKVVALAGWSSVGDKPVTHYFWDDANTEANNDVDIVNATGISTGRWCLINEFAAGFDVRNAGCFATATSAGDIEQTYALQRANTYCNKVGVKMVIPHTMGTQASCYKLSNIILTAPLYVEDRVRLYTPDSASLNLTNDNRYRTYPFIMRDDSNTGDWSIYAEEIETAWFGNQATNKENWRPTLSPRTRLIYNKRFDTTYNAANDPFNFENIAVDVLVKNTDKLVLESCEIRQYGKIACPCEFVACTISEGIFDPDIAEATFAEMDFSGCFSDFGNWKTPNRFVIYKALNGDTTIDLQGQYTDVDLNDYGIEFCFQRIDNAIFETLRMPQKFGSFLPSLYMHNTLVNHLMIYGVNTALTYWSMDDCKISLDSGATQLTECRLYANNCQIGGYAELAVKYANVRECQFQTQFKILDYAANICDCQIFSNDVTIVLNSSQFFDVVCNGNTFHSMGQLVLDLNGKSNAGLSSCSFCDNVVTDSPRDFIDVKPNGGSFSSNEDNLDYIYKGNTGVVKKERYEEILSIPYYKYNDVIPDDVKVYFKQVSNNSDEVKLYGVSLGDLLFSFGENAKKDVFVKLYADTVDPSWYLLVMDGNGTTHQYNYHDCAKSYGIIYRKGTPQNRALFNDATAGFNAYVGTTATSGSTVACYLCARYFE